MVERAFDAVAQRPEGDRLGLDGYGARLDLRQVENVVDQREKIGAGRVDVPGEIHLFGHQVAGRVFGKLLSQYQDRVERRPQLMRHVGQELRLVFRRQCQFGGLLLQRAARLFDLVVLTLDLDVLLSQLLRFERQLFVGLLQLGLPRLQLDRQLLRLLQQVLGTHRRLDRVEDDADRLGQLFEE